MCDFVWSVYMISASNCQTPYKKLTRIVKGPIIKLSMHHKVRGRPHNILYRLGNFFYCNMFDYMFSIMLVVNQALKH